MMRKETDIIQLFSDQLNLTRRDFFEAVQRLEKKIDDNEKKLSDLIESQIRIEEAVKAINMRLNQLPCKYNAEKINNLEKDYTELKGETKNSISFTDKILFSPVQIIITVISSVIVTIITFLYFQNKI